MINQPFLPAKTGYIEIVNENGEHVYAPTQDTIDKQKMMDDITISSDVIESNKADADEQLLNIQMALCETYENNDKQLTDLQAALCEVYELVLGGMV